MKKTKALLCTLVCAAILLSLSACGNAEAFTTSDNGTSVPNLSSPSESDEKSAAVSTGENTGGTSSEQKTPEGAPELVLLDGNKASEDEIVKCTAYSESTDGNPYIYEVNTVFAYPFAASNDERNSENGSASAKLNVGSKWGDFTVTKAEASYETPLSAIPGGIKYQYLGLKGNISFECKADYFSVERNILQIVLELPEEAAKKLPSLRPYYSFLDASDNSDGCRFFVLNPDCELSRRITEKLEAGEEFTVSLSAEEFEVRYTYFGLITDGATTGFLDNVTDFEIN